MPLPSPHKRPGKVFSLPLTDEAMRVRGVTCQRKWWSWDGRAIALVPAAAAQGLGSGVWASALRHMALTSGGPLDCQVGTVLPGPSSSGAVGDTHGAVGVSPVSWAGGWREGEAQPERPAQLR